jgi:hypothetical protein
MTDAARMAENIQITAGGMLQLHTDGVFEAQNHEGESSEKYKCLKLYRQNLVIPFRTSRSPLWLARMPSYAAAKS